MPRVTQPQPMLTIEGELKRTGDHSWTFITAGGREYRVTEDSYSGLSTTEKRFISAEAEGKSHSLSFIRKYPKRGGVRVNCLDLKGNAWSDKDQATDAMARHCVARVEKRLSTPAVSLRSLLKAGAA